MLGQGSRSHTRRFSVLLAEQPQPFCRDRLEGAVWVTGTAGYRANLRKSSGLSPDAAVPLSCPLTRSFLVRKVQ